jgi:hypothetical protein
MNFCLAFALYAAAKATMQFALAAASNTLTASLYAVLVVRFDYPNVANLRIAVAA